MVKLRLVLACYVFCLAMSGFITVFLAPVVLIVWILSGWSPMSFFSKKYDSAVAQIKKQKNRRYKR